MIISEDDDGDILETDYFVDEAGDPALFNRKGHVIVGTEGCSKYFMLGKLDIEDPGALSNEMEALRNELLRDPYFKNVPSMQPEARKTARAFHAKDDLPEVRHAVFKLLTSKKGEIRFYAVVRDKRELVSYVHQRNERDAKYRYTENEAYDTLVSELFRKFRFSADVMRIRFARRGAKDRTRALERALEEANREFQRSYGFPNDVETTIACLDSAAHCGLQAVDYYLWALQRFYERDEERYIDLIWPQVGEVHDLDFIEEGRRGVIYRKDNVLSIESRTPPKKKRRI